MSEASGGSAGGIDHDTLRRAAEAAALGVWEIDVATDTVRGTPQFFRIMGLAPTDGAVPMSVLRAIRNEADRESVNAGYRTAVATGSDSYESEFRIRWPDGSERWILGRGRVIRDRAGRPVRYSGVDVDVTERRRTMQALADREAQLKLAIEATHLGVWDWNLRTGEMVWSERAKAIAGLPPEVPVTFEIVRDITHPDDLPRTSEMARRALDPAIRSREPYEYRLLRPDGSVRWVLAHGEAIFAVADGQTRAERYTGTIQDITARKAAEQSMRESEARLRLAVDAARLCIWELDVPTRELTATPELRAMLGFDADEPVTMDTVNARYFPGERERIQAVGAEALARGERFMQAEFRYCWPDGSIRWLLLRAEILFATGGVPAGALGVLMDITDEKEAEEHRQLLIAELQHRVKNTLSLVGAIANRTFASAVGGDALAAFSARLAALGRAHGLLTSGGWRRADLRALTAATLDPHAPGDRVGLSGPDVELDPRRATSMALAINELATNAAKYGALSAPAGRIEIAWQVGGSAGCRSIVWTWREKDGPPVRKPEGEGFGTRLIRDNLAADFDGEVELAFARKGVVCTLSGFLDPRPPEADRSAPVSPAPSGSARKARSPSRSKPPPSRGRDPSPRGSRSRRPEGGAGA